MVSLLKDPGLYFKACDLISSDVGVLERDRGNQVPKKQSILQNKYPEE